MPENRCSDWPMLLSRRRLPIFAVGGVILRTSVSFKPGQLLRRAARTLSPVIARPRFDPRIVIEISEMNGSGFAKRHLWRRFAVGIFPAQPMILEKFSELPLGQTEM
jgi:hypothetical protein